MGGGVLERRGKEEEEGGGRRRRRRRRVGGGGCTQGENMLINLEALFNTKPSFHRGPADLKESGAQKADGSDITEQLNALKRGLRHVDCNCSI